MSRAAQLQEGLQQALADNDVAAMREIGEEASKAGHGAEELIHHWAMGEVALREFDFVAAYQYLDRAVELSNSQNDARVTSMVLQSFGNVHYYIGNYAQALDRYHEARGLIERIPDQRHRTARLKSNIANVLLYSDEDDQAEVIYREVREQAEALGDNIAAARAINNLALISRNRKHYDQAISYYEESLAILRDLQQDEDVIIIIANLCEVMIEGGRTDGLDELMAELRERSADHDSMYTFYLNLRSGQEVARGDVDTAWETIQESLRSSRELGSREPMINALQYAMGLARRRGDLETYIAFRDESDRLNSEVRGMDARLRIAFQTKESELEAERRKHERERALLYGALPASVADRLIAGEDVSGDHADEVSVLFLDIVGFTMIAERISAKHLLDLLRAVFKVCDDACRDFGLTKIKTIGDAFLAVAGVPEFRMDHAQCTANAAIKIMKDLDTLEITSLTSTGSASDTSSPDNSWIKEVGTIKVRIGLHSGPVVAGIVGEERLQYDIWGDTVNIASRMESTGEPGKIQVSESFTDALNLVPRTSIENLEPGTWNLELRGETAIKGKGTMRTYWLEGA